MPSYKHENESENTLLGTLLEGDEHAWDMFVTTYGPMMLAASRKAFRRHGFQASEHDTEDAVAAVWENLLQKNAAILRNCHERNNLAQTLYTLTRNRSVDIMRKRHNMLPLCEDFDLAAPTPDATPLIPEEALHDALQHLPERDRSLVWLFYWQKKKYHEIATLTGIPQNSIGPTLSRAMQRLRGILEQQGVEAP